MITMFDLVKAQLKVALGMDFVLDQNRITFKGHAMECRINAEDPVTFIPSPGKITKMHPPGGFGIRFDSHIYSGYTVPPYYDSLLAKIITATNKRKSCIKRMKNASRIMVTAYNKSGSQTIDHYSLMGFTKAYNAAKKSCT